jgi:phosphoribosylformylglycinamidine synthase subunit PurS
MSAHARIIVTLRKEVLDPAGLAVQKALVRNGMANIEEVRIGKVVDLYFAQGEGEGAFKERVQNLAHTLIRNPLMEDVQIEYDFQGQRSS